MGMAQRKNGLTLTEKDYVRFRDLVQERSGLYFPPERRHTLAKGLAEAMTTAQNGVTLDSYYRLLSVAPSASREWDQLVGVLTVGETYFFRNKGHFDALREQILPELIEKRRGAGRRIRIWSAGCASGEEPYSIAILLRELIPDIERWNILILATDINPRALEKARKGVYGGWSFRGVEQRIRETHFRRQDKDRYAIASEIKTMVTFEYLNLVEDRYPSLINNTHGMDLILCRNVTIYFDQAVTGRVVRQFHECLADGGWFIPGASEPNMVSYRAFGHRSFPGAVIYQKSDGRTKRTDGAFSFARKPPVEPSAPNSPVVAPAPAPLAPNAPAGAEDAYAEALDRLRRKVTQDPDFAPAYQALGQIYADQGEWETARRWCEKAIERDQLSPKPYFTLAMIALERDRLDEAAGLLKKTLYLDPLFILGHYTLAHVCRQRGEEKMARRSLQNVRRLLVGKPPKEPISGGDGLTAGRLLEMVELLVVDSLKSTIDA
jgi:chemotaxis protein methyltransferase CheR